MTGLWKAKVNLCHKAKFGRLEKTVRPSSDPHRINFGGAHRRLITPFPFSFKLHVGIFNRAHRGLIAKSLVDPHRPLITPHDLSFGGGSSEAHRYF